MARREVEGDEILVTVPLRRLMTGVPRPARAAAAIPRIKRYVRRHVPSNWLDAVTTDDDPSGRIWIDYALNATIWRRGREHIAGPEVWDKSKGSSTKRLAKKTSVRHGSVLKVRVVFIEDPADGSDPRLEVSLPGIKHITREERRIQRRKGTEDEGEEGQASDKEEGEEGAGESEEVDAEEVKEEKEAPKKPAADKPPAKEAPKQDKAPPEEKKGAASKSAAAKGAKKPASKPKKEGGD